MDGRAQPAGLNTRTDPPTHDVASAYAHWHGPRVVTTPAAVDSRLVFNDLEALTL